MNVSLIEGPQRRDRSVGRLGSALLAVAVIGVVAALSGCTEDGRDAIRDGVGTVTITLPARDDGAAGSPETTATTAQEPSPTTEASPPETAPPPTVAPETTSAPETTVPATDPDSDDGLAQSGLLVVALIAAAAVLIFLIGRRSSRSAASVPPVPPHDGRPPWQDRARALYADARWLLDNTDRTFVAMRSAAATGDAQAMSADLEVRRRLDSLLTALYEAEADAPSGSMRQVLRE
ncbi:MAG: hypothetical protein VKL39_24540, partial [Leptolyngbyaceae bacterium]|nr:hypothetical protein [Leptolyngbyaceae bacterium]